MKKLKSREREIYRYIKDFGIEHGYLPSIREICDGVGLKSTSSVFGYMEDMRVKGYIKREFGSEKYSVKGLQYMEVEE